MHGLRLDAGTASRAFLEHTQAAQDPRHALLVAWAPTRNQRQPPRASFAPPGPCPPLCCHPPTAHATPAVLGPIPMFPGQHSARAAQLARTPPQGKGRPACQTASTARQASTRQSRGLPVPMCAFHAPLAHSRMLARPCRARDALLASTHSRWGATPLPAACHAEKDSAHLPRSVFYS